MRLTHTATRLIAKQDYTPSDQALTDSFHKGFDSDDSWMSQIGEKIKSVEKKAAE